MKIEVTIRDIIQCNKRISDDWASLFGCPVESAIYKAVGERCEINGYGWVCNRNGKTIGHIDLSVVDKIRTFQMGNDIEPFEFELSNPTPQNDRPFIRPQRF